VPAEDLASGPGLGPDGAEASLETGGNEHAWQLNAQPADEGIGELDEP
jgi:hypothetical protein